jgi:hypothetical protein
MSSLCFNLFIILSKLFQIASLIDLSISSYIKASHIQMAGLGLFCSAFIRRRRRRHSSPLLPSYGTSLNPTRKFVHIPDHHRLKLGGQPPPPVRSVLAARTCAAAAMPIGTPIGVGLGNK